MSWRSRGPALLGMLLLGCPILAAELRGVHFQDRVEVDHVPLILNGVGLRQKTIFKVDVYVAALYLSAPTSDSRSILAAREPRQLQVVFLRNVSVEDLVRSWDEGFAMNCPVKCTTFDGRLLTLKRSMTPVRRGQRIVFNFLREGMTIATEGRRQNYAGKDFADMVLANFIGVPPSRQLKEGLLGTAAGDR